ncbi:MAG: NAD(P)H-hydrate epimerase [Promethearchaeota archaeon]
MKIPKITSEQMREIDANMVKYQISTIQMMENAGRNLATLARSNFLKGNVMNKKIFVFVGSGGNGGGGLTAARFLFNWGAYVNVFMTKTIEELSGPTKHQALILENIGVPLHTATSLSDIHTPVDVDLILDAIIGYSLVGEPRGTAAILIEFANSTHIPILSLDVPSGLDATTGETFGPHTVKSTATMTLGLPKTGLFKGNGKVYTGDLYLADISVPLEVYKEQNLEPSNGIFHNGSIIKLRF